MTTLAAIILCVVIAALIGYGLYLHLTGDPMDDEDDPDDT